MNTTLFHTKPKPRIAAMLRLLLLSAVCLGGCSKPEQPAVVEPDPSTVRKIIVEPGGSPRADEEVAQSDPNAEEARQIGDKLALPLFKEDVLRELKAKGFDPVEEKNKVASRASIYVLKDAASSITFVEIGGRVRRVTLNSSNRQEANSPRRRALMTALTEIVAIIPADAAQAALDQAIAALDAANSSTITKPPRTRGFIGFGTIKVLVQVSRGSDNRALELTFTPHPSQAF